MVNGIVTGMAIQKDGKTLFTIKTYVATDSLAYKILMDSIDNEKYIELKLDGERNEI